MHPRNLDTKSTRLGASIYGMDVRGWSDALLKVVKKRRSWEDDKKRKIGRMMAVDNTGKDCDRMIARLLEIARFWINFLHHAGTPDRSSLKELIETMKMGEMSGDETIRKLCGEFEEMERKKEKEVFRWIRMEEPTKWVFPGKNVRQLYMDIEESDEADMKVVVDIMNKMKKQDLFADRESTWSPAEVVIPKSDLAVKYRRLHDLAEQRKVVLTEEKSLGFDYNQLIDDTDLELSMLEAALKDTECEFARLPRFKASETEMEDYE